MKDARKALRASKNSGWWTLDLNPCQTVLVFNAIVRSKYRYGLVLMEPTQRMEKADHGSSNAALKAPIKKSTTLHVMARRKMFALFQWEKLDALVSPEARRTV